jgi:hypothetical protein
MLAANAKISDLASSRIAIAKRKRALFKHLRLDKVARHPVSVAKMASKTVHRRGVSGLSRRPKHLR